MSKFNFRISTSAVALAAALIVAGCAVTQPIPPKYDLPPGSATAAQNEALGSTGRCSTIRCWINWSRKRWRTTSI